MVELVNNHVLFPHPADWSSPPDWSRQWHNEIGTAVTGAESRHALRVQPRASLAFTVTPRDVVEQSELDDRIRAALKSGYACAPYHGRGSLLTATASGTAVTVQSGRTWSAGEYLFLQSANDTYEVRLLTVATLVFGVWNLEFSGDIAGTYPAGTFVWPLLFGEFTCDTMNARAPRTGPARVSIRELVAPASVTLGSVTPPGGTGIGSMAIADDFAIA